MDNSAMEVVAPQSGSSSIGDAVSGRRLEVGEEEEDEDLYYIPERRPSLDLGPDPMDTSQWHFVRRFSPPALSYCSMTSEEDNMQQNSMDIEDRTSSDTCTRVQLDRADSFSSCYSWDSDDCEKKTLKVKNKEDMASDPADDTPELMEDPKEIRHPSLTVAFTFKALSDTLKKLSKADFQTFKTTLWKRYPQSFTFPSLDLVDLVDLVDRLLECYSLEVSLKITEALLQDIGLRKLVDYLQTLRIRNEVRYDVSETLKNKYGVHEESSMQGETRLFQDIYTDLYITSTSENGPNIEHEVMTIEKLDSNQDRGTRLSTGDILNTKILEESNIKLIMVSGVAGSGKSVAVRRLVLDWMEGRSHQHVSFMFPLPFRELHQFEGVKISLLDIIHTLYPATKKLREEDFKSEDCRIMLIFDGLDEYSDKLDFQNTELLFDHTDPTTLNVIVVNLLRGRLLYRGLFVITSRSQIKRCIPWDTPYSKVEVHGFCDPERDEYFRKRFQDPDQASRVTECINSMKTLRIMCHLPLFCSLVADEYQRIFRERGAQAQLPRSITYMYTKLILALTHERRRFRAPERGPDEERDFLVELGKLAFNMLEKGQFKITKVGWKEQVRISDDEAVNLSGLCTQFITKPFVLIQERVFSFIHPTVQEYLAALYVFLSFKNQGTNVFGKVSWKLKGHKALELYKCALDRSLMCEDGKLDVFLRFLFGMMAQINQELLQPFCSSSVKWPSAVTEDAAALIRKKIEENQYPGRTENLRHCLEELGV